jgi:hypothetical protein
LEDLEHVYKEPEPQAPQGERYNVRMDIAGIVAEIDLEIARLEKAKALIAGQPAPAKRGRPPATKPKTAATSFAFGTNTAPPKRKMSAEGRARIAAAQKARWAKAKKG